MARPIEAMRAVERAPLRTVRLQTMEHLGANPWRTLNRLVDQGALTRLAHGVYAAPPDGRDGRTWKPTLEAAALAVATARFGNRRAVLMGIGAARHWAAVPRAVGITTIAVPDAGRSPVTLDIGGIVHFIPRDLGRLDAVLERTELGQALVTTPAQTLFDLLMKPNQGGAANVAAEAARNLAARASADELREVVEPAARVNAVVRQTLTELEERDGQTR